MKSSGYYVMGKYTSVAWFLIRAEAEAYCKQANYRGGTVYRVVEDCKMKEVSR